ncbi:MAG: ATP-dependent helicase/nuclease subunit A [Lentimonas sp.]
MPNLDSITNLQNSASNPEYSAFVSASAGSGKTKVLVDRVLRLLLAGTLPSKILCLTFTKVAAIQMQQRIFRELEDWVMFDDIKLTQRLKNIGLNNPSKFEFDNARKLFIKLLDDDSGLQISTIHSFCQSIISRFPVEAKASPNFNVIDEQKENELLFEARKAVLNRALVNEDLAKRIHSICSSLNENSFLDICSEIIRKRQNLNLLKEQYFDIYGVVAAIYKRLGINLQEDESTILENYIQEKCWEDLNNLCQKTEIKSKSVIKNFISNPNLDNLSSYIKVFLTAENLIRKSFTNAGIRKIFPDADVIMREEAELILQLNEKISSSRIAINTSNLLISCDEIIDNYRILKAKNNFLDYEDLISKTNILLENSENRSWIKYKLDGSFEHILVDESQDTNSNQWNIIKAITEEFFAGEFTSESKKRPTIFIVGDEKQSIYSFQGAQPDIFANIFHYYQEQLNSVNQQFLNVKLNSSFRSLPTILETVDSIFSKPELKNSISKLALEIEHQAVKNNHCGKITLMPLVESLLIKEEVEYDWELDFTKNQEPKYQEILAKQIVQKIKSLLNTKKFLACKTDKKNKQVEFGDVMILLKERQSNLGSFLIKYLTEEEIPVSSATRINFSGNIIIQDLISFAKFILLQADDLNLACLLKSTLFDLKDEQLERICIVKNKKGITLFEALEIQNSNLHQELLNLINENKNHKFGIYEFFSNILISKKKQKNIVERFGSKAKDIIDQFFKTCLNYHENNISSSLDGFINFLETYNPQIKINSSDQNLNQVQISTIHSAKGLEAPIVFLADCAHSIQKQLGGDRSKIFWEDESGLPFWSNGKDSDNELIKSIKASSRKVSKDEYWRQLYVALTRAKEELYICGFASGKIDANCWYEIIKETIAGKAISVNDEFFGEGALVIGDDFKSDYSLEDTKREANKKTEIFNKSFEKLPELEEKIQFIYPSNPSNKYDEEKANLGILIHKILEEAPISSEAQEYFIRKYLDDEILINRVLKVFKENRKILSHPNSKSEVQVMARINGKTISGKIDRLIIKEDEILIIDFKTGQKSDLSDEENHSQMNFYEKSVRKIYPDKNVKSQIIWV